MSTKIKEEKEQETTQTEASEEEILNHQKMLMQLSNPSEQTYNILARLDSLIKNGKLLNVLIERLVIAEEKRNDLEEKEIELLDKEEHEQED